ncbi:MAG TPA: hypothetical protein VMB50_17385 [Myxococcales bacterium]|nr:hypothetical protein [Myxococcales bacterium]
MHSEGTTSGPAEMRRLREALRDRRGVDHLARAWSTGLVFLLLCGAWIKLAWDAVGWPILLWPGALLCLAVLAFCLRELRRGLSLLAEDRTRLARLHELEAQAPPPRELF